MIEIPDHPWFLAASSIEFTSTARGHPLFTGFVRAAANIIKTRRGTDATVPDSKSAWTDLFLIAGTCVIESEQLALETAGT